MPREFSWCCGVKRQEIATFTPDNSAKGTRKGSAMGYRGLCNNSSHHPTVSSEWEASVLLLKLPIVHNHCEVLPPLNHQRRCLWLLHICWLTGVFSRMQRFLKQRPSNANLHLSPLQQFLVFITMETHRTQHKSHQVSCSF